MPDRRDVTEIEAPFLSADPAEIFALGDQLRRDGHSAPVVAGIEAWLLRKALGHPDQTAQPTRARYRKILAAMAPVPPRRRRRSQGGRAPLAVPVGVTAAGLAALATHDPAVASVVGLYVTCSSGDDLAEAA
jgi:hypothetical protein